jgi:hypothetical protein
VVSGRRARAPFAPTAARFWWCVEVVLLIVAAAAFGVALGGIFGEAVNSGRWQVTGETAAMGFVGVFFGALTALSNVFRLRAIKGPGSASRGPNAVEEPGADELEPDCPDCGTPWGAAHGPDCPYHAWAAANDLDADDEVPDDVREDARQHADEDDPYGVIGGAQ